MFIYTPCTNRTCLFLILQFAGGDNSWFVKKGSGRKHLEQCEYNYLKSMYSGYKGAIGQPEFLLHIVENAPALVVLTVEIAQRLYGDLFSDMVYAHKFGRATACLESGALQSMVSSKVKLCVT